MSSDEVQGDTYDVTGRGVTTEFLTYGLCPRFGEKLTGGSKSRWHWRGLRRRRRHHGRGTGRGGGGI